MRNIAQCGAVQKRHNAPMRRRPTDIAARCILLLAVCGVAIADSQAWARARASPEHAQPVLERQTFTDAQSLFYNARYEAAAALTLALRGSNSDDLASDELRSSALLFQLKALLEGRHEKNTALRDCTTCPALMADFFAEIHHGQALAHVALQSDPKDEAALFFLGKLDLNYVWLQLGPLHKKTGWDEYWEARRSLDQVLKINPQRVRARIARAWIDYIVDSKMPFGTRWVLGGGNRKQALKDVREAALIESDFFTHTEAEFALWDMQVREGDMVRATDVARTLARDFPDNRELTAFIDAREASSRR
jgi:tetratricopeptide (TPR) repeat protein